jgi:hypothetical protein
VNKESALAILQLRASVNIFRSFKKDENTRDVFGRIGLTFDPKFTGRPFIFKAKLDYSSGKPQVSSFEPISGAAFGMAAMGVEAYKAIFQEYLLKRGLK